MSGPRATKATNQISEQVAAAPNEDRSAGGNALTWLLLALVIAAIVFVGWWAFAASGVKRAPEVRVIGGVSASPAASPAALPSGAALQSPEPTATSGGASPASDAPR